MNIQTFAQLAESATNALSVLVIALGYYFTVGAIRRSVEEMRAGRLEGGRPAVALDIAKDDLPDVNLSIRHVVGGPIKEITFEFALTYRRKPLVALLRFPCARL